MTIAAGWRRRAARAFTVRSLSIERSWASRSSWSRSLQQVDRGEQGDPHHVDEVPVVGGHDRAGRLGVGVATRREGAADDEQEREQATGDVQAVEAGREVEDGPVGV